MPLEKTVAMMTLFCASCVPPIRMKYLNVAGQRTGEREGTLVCPGGGGGGLYGSYDADYPPPPKGPPANSLLPKMLASGVHERQRRPTLHGHQHMQSACTPIISCAVCHVVWVGVSNVHAVCMQCKTGPMAPDAGAGVDAVAGVCVSRRV